MKCWTSSELASNGCGKARIEKLKWQILEQLNEKQNHKPTYRF